MKFFKMIFFKIKVLKFIIYFKLFLKFLEYKRIILFIIFLNPKHINHIYFHIYLLILVSICFINYLNIFKNLMFQCLNYLQIFNLY